MTVSNLIVRAAGNSLLEFLSGRPYLVDDLVVVRKEGEGLVVEADPYGRVGVTVTPLDDKLQLLAEMCASYEAIVGSYDPMTEGKLSHRSAATQAIQAYKLRNCLNELDIEWRSQGRFGVVISPLSFYLADFEVAENEEGEVSAKTPVGVFVFDYNPDREEVTLNLWL